MKRKQFFFCLSGRRPLDFLYCHWLFLFAKQQICQRNKAVSRTMDFHSALDESIFASVHFFHSILCVPFKWSHFQFMTDACAFCIHEKWHKFRNNILQFTCKRFRFICEWACSCQCLWRKRLFSFQLCQIEISIRTKTENLRPTIIFSSFFSIVVAFGSSVLFWFANYGCVCVCVCIFSFFSFFNSRFSLSLFNILEWIVPIPFRQCFASVAIIGYERRKKRKRWENWERKAKSEQKKKCCHYQWKKKKRKKRSKISRRSTKKLYTMKSKKREPNRMDKCECESRNETTWWSIEKWMANETEESNTIEEIWRAIIRCRHSVRRLLTLHLTVKLFSKFFTFFFYYSISLFCFGHHFNVRSFLTSI